jgi:hypothetical protein
MRASSDPTSKSASPCRCTRSRTYGTSNRTSWIPAGLDTLNPPTLPYVHLGPDHRQTTRPSRAARCSWTQSTADMFERERKTKLVVPHQHDAWKNYCVTTSRETYAPHHPYTAEQDDGSAIYRSIICRVRETLDGSRLIGFGGNNDAFLSGCYVISSLSLYFFLQELSLYIWYNIEF